MTDPISDMLIRIKNAQAVRHETLSLPFSNIKLGIATILQKEGFIGDIEKRGRKDKKALKFDLKYSERGPAIKDAKRISKPGQRIYVASAGIKNVRGGYGISIISTSKGLLTGKEAKAQNLGGEILCEIW